MTPSIEWLEAPTFTGKKGWRWEAPARWLGEELQVSVWHDSSAPMRAGRRADPQLSKRIASRLARALRDWAKQRARAVKLFEAHRARHFPSARKVTGASLGPVTVELPNGLRGSRVDFSFKACGLFGANLFPQLVVDRGSVDAQLETRRDAKGKALARYDPEKHVVGATGPPPPKFGKLPARSAIKPLKVPWLSPFAQVDGEWRAKVKFMGRPLLVVSVQETEPKADEVYRALGTYILAKQLVAQRAAHLYDDGGWGSKPMSAGKVEARLKLRALSMLDGQWTLVFGDGGLFGGHEVHGYPEGREVEVDLVG
jgi:hypothetical protein